MSKKSKIFIIIALILTLLWGVGVGYIAKSLTEKDPVQPINNNCPEGTKVELLCKTGGSFFSDSLILVSQQGEEELTISLDINRREQNNEYNHYYSGEIIYSGQHFPLRSNFTSPSSEVQLGSIFSKFERIQKVDLSSRYDYLIVIPQPELGEIKISLSTESDFIAKDSLLNLTTYSSTEAIVEIQGKILVANAMVKRIESIDSTKYLFFDGYNKANLVSQQLVFWDEEDNFYLIDQTEVKEEYFGYKPHSWLLHKNIDENFTQKRFDFDIKRFEQGGLKWDFKFGLPRMEGSVHTTQALEVNNYDFIIVGDFNGGKKLKGMATSINMVDGIVNPKD